MQDRIKKIKAIVEKYRINKTSLAEQANMVPYTLRMKLTGANNYELTEKDVNDIEQALLKMCNDIKKRLE